MAERSEGIAVTSLEKVREKKKKRQFAPPEFSQYRVYLQQDKKCVELLVALRPRILFAWC